MWIDELKYWTTWKEDRVDRVEEKLKTGRKEKSVAKRLFEDRANVKVKTFLLSLKFSSFFFLTSTLALFT